MLTIAESRRAFLERIKPFTQPVERPYFEDALDDFIRWSDDRSAQVSHVAKEYKQHVVSFQLVTRGIVLWSAYPRKDGGAKLEILPGSADELDDSARQDALNTLRPISREEISEATTLRVPFTALKNKSNRRDVKDLLSRLLVSLGR